MQYSIFNFLYPDFKINKPLRLIELFAGYGSQALALKYLGKEFEHHRICEWAIKSIQAYNDIHIKDYTDYSQPLSEEQIKDFLFKKGISSNYNEPMTRKAIDRLSEKQARTIYNNIIATHNLVNIQQVHGDDLDISGDYIYMMTYSFPCQDLSLAGKTAGMSKGTGTRSGMLWEVERILKECKQLPQILLMENVPQVHSVDNTPDFNEWQFFLESLGYKNYWQDLSATDYGIPQTRNRCFMISLLGDFNYTFPQPETLKIRLKDLLEPAVDEKYFLSDRMINYICANNDKWTGNNNESIINKSIASTINTGEGLRRCDASNYISDVLEENANIKEIMNLYNLGLKQYNRRTGVVLSPEGAMTTLLARTQGDNSMIVDYIPIRTANSKGYILAEEGDGVDISTRMEYHRGTVQKGKTQSLTTMGGENNGVVMSGLRIRKLTPRECFRLMGVHDDDFDSVAKNQSNASLYHLAGDSIVVNVLMAIFKELYND